MTRTSAVLASHALAAAGHGDLVWGHASVRDPAGRGIWIKAAGWGLEEADEARTLLVGFDGAVLEGDGTPHLECPLHLEILAARPELGSVVHTHAPAAVAFAALDTPLLALSHDGALFAGEDVPRFTATGGLVRTPALGHALAATLGAAPAALMPSHGLAAAGRTAAHAVMHAVLLERACRVQLDALAVGPVRVHSDAEEARAKAVECWPDHQLEAGFDYLVRAACERNPALRRLADARD